AAPPNAIIGGLVDAGRDSDGGHDTGGTFDPDAAVIDAPPDVVTLTQTATNMVISANSIACYDADTDITFDNNFYRVFTPADASVTGALHLTQVDFGIQVATSTSGNGQPATLKIGTYAGTVTPTTATLTGTITNLVTKAITIKDTAAPTAMTVPVIADIAAGTSFVVELDLPNTGNKFFIGSNAGTETKPGFVGSTNCNITTPKSFKSLATNGPVSIVMSATGTTTPSR
ncbi:MAG TPA: hypothetical protein VGC42_30270, partial [Kofleriaceae bacterium]